MGLFDILIGISSIGFFVVAIIALVKVHNIEKAISISVNNSNRAKQSLKNVKVENGSIMQTGRDNRGE